MCQPGVSGMRPSAIGRPRWGLLYGLVAAPLTALALVELSGLANPARAALRSALALGTFIALAAWVRASRARIDLQDWCECAGRSMTIRVVSSGRAVPAPPPDQVEPEPAPVPAGHELVER
jgi:hypothetical protein